MKISECAFEQIDAAAQMYFMPYKVFKTAFSTCFEQQWHQYITDGLRSSAGKTRWNIGNTIVNNAVLHKDRLLMTGDLRCFKTTATVYTNIDDHTARPHV